ncbi:non-ribosomal peptide synthetase [Brevibacterium oceani]|uniref:non-ribosomal peptide synthetase n=1 Tax=Brevibacterium oceani TaxID=358099 RepID=UPI001B3421D1|nr:non-ribosomal peptide synthetase [Brevibacterium oceani]
MTDENTRIDLTSAQRGIWYAQKIEPDNPTFQIGLYVDIRGPLDVDRMREAVATTVAEADSLNVVFGEDEKGPFQQLGPARSHLLVRDLRTESSEDPEDSAHALMQEDLDTVHDVDEGDLLRSQLFCLGDDHWIFYQRAHHLLVDGYSAVLVLRRESQVYRELADQGTASDSPFGSLDDLVAEEAQYRSSQRFATDAEFWKQMRSESETATSLAERPASPARRLVTCNADIPQELSSRLAGSRSAPTLILSAAAAYLHRMTGRESISVGLPVTARRSALSKSVPSMMSKILPVQLQAAPEMTTADLVAGAGATLREALIHQRFQYQELSTDSDYIGPSVNIFPHVDDIDFGMSTASLHLLSTGPVDDLSIIIHGIGADPSSEGGSRPAIVRFEANAELYDQHSLAEHLRQFLSVLCQFDPSGDQHLAGLSLIAADESDELIAGGKGPEQSLPRHTVVEEFSRHARRSPFATAVVAEDGHISFGELDRRSTQLADRLRDLGAGPGARIAARLGRSTTLPVAVLGILRTGAAYVPLDPDYPADRIEAMIADAAPVLVINSSTVSGPAGETNMTTDRPVIDIDAQPQSAAPAAESTQAGSAQAGSAQTGSAQAGSQQTGSTPAPDDLAYVIFTSGSTGRPKGIGVEHRSLLNLFHSHKETIFDPAARRLGRGLRVAHTAGISFDASWDPLLWLFAGHELHLIDSVTRRDPETLTDYFSAHGIDSIETTPSFVKALLAHGTFSGTEHPSVVALGGEAVERGLWDQLAALPEVDSYNLYGPAETTVDSLTAPIVAGASPDLGGSVANTRHYVLDSRLAPVPAQARGELYIAGLNLARGYVGRPATTSERFIADPFADDGSRMYRTGDIVRRPLAGGIEFLGRADEQIKLRGYRVELSEVELALQSEDRIRSAAVILGQNRAGYSQLLGYITADEQIDAAEVRRHMKTRVPDYMVPSFITQIERIPLTVNGKLDRAALPEPESTRSESAAPRTVREQAVAEAFAQVLGVETVGIDDDFFELGGHSLLATQLVASLRKRFAAPPALSEVFHHPTVRELSAGLDLGDTAEEPAHELVAAGRPATIPLSYAQSRLWFLNQFDPTSAAYNIPLTLRIRGDLDTGALRAAINDVVSRHESLRTVFPWTEGQPHQVIRAADDAQIALPIVEISEDLVDHTVDAEATHGFDVSTQLPIRALLVRLGADDHLLLLTLHHIAADGWSLRPLAGDLSDAYRARARGTTPTIPELPIQYADYALWQRRTLGSEEDPDSEIADQLAHWKDALSGAPVELRLPVDRPRSAQNTDRVSRRIPIDIDAETHAGLRRLSGERNASLFMVLQAAFAVLLSRLGAGTDIPIGTPVAGRTETKLDDLIGFFVNTLVLRTDTSGNPSLVDVVDRVRASNLSAYANQDAPFERVVDELAPPRSDQLHPLFQVMLTLQNTAPAALDMGDLDVEPAPGPQVSEAKFDLLLDLAERENDGATHTVGDMHTVSEAAGITGSLEFDSALFDESTAEAIAARFVRVIDQFAADPHTPLRELEVLSPDEIAEIRAQGQGRDAVAPESTILDVLDSTIRSHPERRALIADDGELTFARLGALIDQIAHVLAARGITAGDSVAIALPRSADAIAAPLAVLSIGAVAVPIDLSYPGERIRLILDASAPAAIITDEAELPVRPGTAIGTTELHTAELGRRGADRPVPSDRAYEMYTSGSTGTPKGVAVPHSALLNLLAHHRETIFAEAGLDVGPVQAAHTAGLGFDAAWDPVLWLVAGASLHIVGDEIRRDAEALVRFCREHEIRALETTPSFVRQLIISGLFEDDTGGDRVPLSLALGGEAVPEDLWQELAEHPAVRARNFYGPTEFTIDSVTAAVEGDRPTIGHPIRNVRTMVLDQHLCEVPRGVVGDLYLAGAGIASGYVNRPKETATRFVADPLEPGARMYRTGDLVRRNPDGSLDFVSRDDDQIKLRGYRVELGDVENALASGDGVAQAAAIVENPTDPGSARLIGYYTGDADEAALRDHLAAQLPAPMVPHILVGLDSIPLTSHGKLDRSRLPAPAASGAKDSRAARTADERTMCRQFSSVLGTEDIGLDDDFFDLGGHSLLAVSLIGRIRAAFDTELPLRAVFDSPTPAALLHRLDSRGPTEPASTEEPTITAESAGGAPHLSLTAWSRSHGHTRPQLIPLSYGQARLHFLNQLDTDASDYTISLAVRFSGDLDPESLGQALTNVIARHEILRTVYPSVEGSPVQQILPPDAGEGLMEHRTTTSGAETAERMRDEAAVGFDLSRDLPIRASLFTEGDEWVLHLVMHHLATDGASLRPLTQDLSTAYAALRGSAHPMQRTLEVQYAEFALWQRHVLEGEEAPAAEAPLLKRKIRAWHDRLEGIPTDISLPADRPRPTTARQSGRHHHFSLDARTSARLAAVAAENGASLFMALHSVLAGYLSRLGAGEDIVIGSPSAGRSDPALEDMVGLFVNTIPIRTDTSAGPGLRALLARTRAAVIDAVELDDVPFERLVEAVNPPRELGRHPLFQVMLSLEETSAPSLDLPGVTTSVEPEVETGDAKFDLSFTFRRSDAEAGLAVVLDYNSSMFDAETIAGICRRFSRFVDEAVKDPERPLRDIALLDPVDTRTAIESLTGPVPADTPPPVLDVFAATAARMPDAVAARSDRTSLSYRELDAASTRLAHELIDQGAGAGDTVSVRLSRGLGVIVATLAVLKSGAAFNPIDIDYPRGRTTAILTDAAPLIVITQPGSTLAPVPADAGITPSIIEISPADGSARPSPAPQGSTVPRATAATTTATLPAPHRDSAAYVTFTSGSTGRPKGVEVGHAALANLLASHRARFLPTPSDEAERIPVAHTTGIGFDAAWDPLLWMMVGHPLHIVSETVQRDPQRLAADLRRLGIGFWETTPSYLRLLSTEPEFERMLADAAEQGAPIVLALGGEAIDPDLWQWLHDHPGIIAHNLYGPTETTVDAFAAPVGASPTPMLGTPLERMRGYILDERLNHVPSGTIGELYLTGEQLAHGYRGRPGLSAERFVADPHGGPGERMYRTGDLVVRHADGELVFIGRSDDQIQLRGYRVELGEVERALRQAPGVRDAVVRPFGTDPATIQLVGYVVAEAGARTGTATELADAARDHVRSIVPSYMAPSHLVVIDEIPLTAHGKIDEAALPDPSTATVGSRLRPRTPQEEAVVAIFARVLSLPQVGIDESFFELGGHSFLARPLIAAVNEALGAELSVQALFRSPTVEQLVLEAGRGGADSIAESLHRLLPLRRAGTKPPLFAVHPATGISWGFAAMLGGLDPERPLIGLQMPGLSPDDPEEMTAQTLTELADDYITHLQTVQPEGPYHLIGWSLGGILAHRLATRLQERGESVAFLGILDAFPDGQERNADVGEGSELWANYLGANHPAITETMEGLDDERALEILRAHGDPLGNVASETIAAMTRGFFTLARLIREAPVEAFDGELLLFTATRDVPNGTPGPESWRRFVTGDIHVTEVDARHSDMLGSEAVGEILPVLSIHMDEAAESQMSSIHSWNQTPPSNTTRS